jgi:hypothetical protein
LPLRMQQEADLRAPDPACHGPATWTLPGVGSGIDAFAEDLGRARANTAFCRGLAACGP